MWLLFSVVRTTDGSALHRSDSGDGPRMSSRKQCTPRARGVLKLPLIPSYSTGALCVYNLVPKCLIKRVVHRIRNQFCGGPTCHPSNLRQRLTPVILLGFQFESSCLRRLQRISEYVNSVPAERVAQIHIAGHSKFEKYILDTHDHPVLDPVWHLYARAIERVGPTATLLEWDDNIPSFDEVHAEALKATQYLGPVEVSNTAGTLIKEHAGEGVYT